MKIIPVFAEEMRKRKVQEHFECEMCFLIKARKKNNEDYCRGNEKKKGPRIFTLLGSLLRLDDEVSNGKELVEVLTRQCEDQQNRMKCLRSLPFRLCIGVTAGH